MERLDALREELRAFVAEREWAPFHDPKNLAMAVASEAGELLAEYRWVSSDEADALTDDPERRLAVAREIADIGITLLMLCDRLGIDLVDAIREKMTINARRYPVDQARGRSGRPTT